MEKSWIVAGAHADWTMTLSCRWRDPLNEADPPSFSRAAQEEMMHHFCDLVDEHEGVSARRTP
jgi:hypothetical protein